MIRILIFTVVSMSLVVSAISLLVVSTVSLIISAVSLVVSGPISAADVAVVMTEVSC